ncbi:3773_t:CDS:2 [Acaulospora morrowiae]|uniref:3773_t:CDS:1 n=1 Tax=Acaulospora morrowiae TaxID=94023 RepID=A0A9N8VX63_9GLOM|nr:3773_t:CDS:2 [Acaulospora morrowiae]
MYHGRKNNVVECEGCNKLIKSETRWCKHCNSKHFKAEFSNWTSDNAAIDKFIQKSQLAAERHEHVLEWVDYTKFTFLRKVDFSINKEAYWEDGYAINWNSELNKWNRSGRQRVKLITNYCEKYLISSFLKSELELVKSNSSKRLIYGLTRDPESMNYAVIEKLVELCPSCNKKWMSPRWCRGCYSNRFKSERSNWTSGNSDIDEFIYKTQITAEFPEQVLEWIPETRLSELNQIGRGGYGTVFKSYSKVGRIRKWNPKANKWDRDEPMWVALKYITEEENSITEFLKEVNALHECLKINLYSLDCYGITRHPETKKYLIAMRFVEEGDLRAYLSSNFANSTWVDRLDRLWSFAIDLRSLHAANLVHRDLHAGNMLFGKNRRNFISDLGLACEDGQTMKDLVYDIYCGLRPPVIKGTPESYVQLMMQCWDPDPEKRPTAHILAETLEQWILIISKDASENLTDNEIKIRNQFKLAEEERKKNPFPVVPYFELKTHPLAHYTSRVISRITASRQFDRIK